MRNTLTFVWWTMRNTKCAKTRTRNLMGYLAFRKDSAADILIKNFAIYTAKA